MEPPTFRWGPSVSRRASSIPLRSRRCAAVADRGRGQTDRRPRGRARGRGRRAPGRRLWPSSPRNRLTAVRPRNSSSVTPRPVSVMRSMNRAGPSIGSRATVTVPAVGALCSIALASTLEIARSISDGSVATRIGVFGSWTFTVTPLASARAAWRSTTRVTTAARSTSFSPCRCSSS